LKKISSNGELHRKNMVFQRYKYLYLLMIPGALWYIFFHILPLYGIVIAFQDFSPRKGIMGSEWVGLQHLRNLFNSAMFTRTLTNTLKISGLKLLFGFPMPIILALSLNTISQKRLGNRAFKRSIQTITYLPHFLSWVIVAGMSFSIFNQYTGVLLRVFGNLGIPYTDITRNPDTFVSFLVMSSIWKGAGWGSIIYLAALAGIDQQLYEAATIDGATRFQQTMRITIPLLMPICAIILILSVGRILTEDFQQIYLFAGENAALNRVSDVFETYIYRMGIRKANFSFPAAVGIFQSFFGALLVLGSNKVSKKLGYEGIW
jgi:putative aldouronate transport system permease protein